MSQTAKRALEPQRAKKTKKTKGRTKKTSPVIYVLIILLFAVLLGILYYVAAQFYTGRFPNKTEINGIDVSNMTAENAKTAINNYVQTYELTIQERDNVTEVITAEDIGLTYDDNGDVDRLLEEFNPFMWIFHYFTLDSLTAEGGTVCDEEMRDAAVADLDCFDPLWYTPVEDACIKKNNDQFYIQAEVTGNQLDTEKTTALIVDTLTANQKELDLEANDCYLAPTVYKDDESLNQWLTTIQKWLSSEITYDFEDDRIEKANSEVIATWVEEAEDGSYSINRDSAFEWVKTTLAYQYDTFGLTHEVKTHSGKTVTLKGGDYGWCIDRDKTTDALVEAVENGSVEELVPEYKYSAKNRGIDDIGGTYVEISIDDQMMWCYKDYEQVVETPIVTGDISKGYDTPKGSVWALDSHKSPATLGTLDTMGYSSYVNFWMSFVGNVGIHDSSWRGTSDDGYGGDIYLTNGSHGCINTPYDAAKKIYETINVGTAIVVY
jgi:hypothetical protein